MSTVVYILCALTSAGCAALLLRAYLSNRVRLLMWSAVCFTGLAINNVLLTLDRTVMADQDLAAWRSGTAMVSVTVLLLALIWESE
jgi:hypothetical protein